MEAVTSEAIRVTVTCLIGLAALLVSVQKGIEAWHAIFRKKSEDREKAQEERLDALEEDVKQMKARMEDGDKGFEKLRQDIGELLGIQNVVLMHMITGNGIERLKEAKEDLDVYMARR